MKEWKLRQQITHKLHKHDDLIENEEVIVTDRASIRTLDFAHDVLMYFVQEGDGKLYYPQKSYAVALIYARLLEKYFGEQFYDALNDPELLISDLYFVPYNEDREAYDDIIGAANYWKLWDFESNPISYVQSTVHYFKQEFLLD
ncbi:hypothetical protein E4H12_15630 [Candidatus Thorarchaeota archaeon]|nr:MAG: hypothetical protein E4H12_15630 [Candidatus Thorarchaeota archaeon]